jgi:hypothetical protein
MNRTIDDGDLLLTAFRYVSGELSAADVRQFEAKLADDPAAQQALADTVLLGDVLARSTVVVRARPDVRSARQRPRHSVAVLSVVAAFLLLASLWPSLSDRDDSLVKSGPESQRDKRSVLEVWNHLADSDAMGQGLLADALSEGAEEAEPAGDEEEIPEWLLHAVAGTLAPEEEAAPAPETDDAASTDEIDEAT